MEKRDKQREIERGKGTWRKTTVRNERKNDNLERQTEKKMLFCL